MGSPSKQLSARQLERLKSELAEVIISNFCYPSFLDYRLDTLRTRPVDRRKRQEVWTYINSLNFGTLSTSDVGTTEFRRFVERIFLRYIEANRGLIGAVSARRVAVARSQVSQLANMVVRGLADFLTVGEASTFGGAQPVESWSLVVGSPEPTWEHIERSTQLLQTTLVYLWNAAPKHLEPEQWAASPGQPPQEVQQVRREVPPSTVISSLPTVLLRPRPEEPSASPDPTNGAAHRRQVASGGEPHYETMPLELPPGLKPGAKRQFLGPYLSGTASRPLPDSISLSAPSADPLTQMPPLAPPLSAPFSPLSSGEGASSAPLVSLTSQPMASAPLGPAPSSMPQLAEHEDWLALLLPNGEEAAVAPAAEEARRAVGEGTRPPTGAEFELPANMAAEPSIRNEVEPLVGEEVFSSVGPFGADLPELPTSFPPPALRDLPSDLAELYGDYLRDTRLVTFRGGSQAFLNAVSAKTGQDVPDPAPSAFALPAEEAEQLDDLFDVLSSRLAQEEHPERLARTTNDLLLETTSASPQADTPDEAVSAEADTALAPLEAQVSSGPVLPEEHVAVVPSELSSAIVPAEASSATLPPAPVSAGSLQEAEARPLFDALPRLPIGAQPEKSLPASGPLEGAEPPEQPSPLPPAAAVLPGATAQSSKELTDADLLIFAQLQHQVFTWVKIAAVSHQIDISGYDAPGLVGELRHAAVLDEAELQVIESLVALCQRVTNTRQATMDDYKQAMMLYLLHHRSRLAL